MEQKAIQPWLKDGWNVAVWSWITETAREANITIKGPAQQNKASDLGMVLCIPTTVGDLYFKATLPVLRFEATLSKFISILHKDNSVAIVDIYENEGWLLMHDIGGKSLRELKDKPLYQRAIDVYANLQVRESEYVEKLVAMGVPDRRLHIVKAEIEEHLFGMCATGLNEEETAAVMALKPELLRMCDDMEGVVPYSIDHGDLHSANIRYVDDCVVFFDWGDATVTHPFFSTRVFWNSLDELIESEDEWLDMVNQFKPYYLAPWTQYASLEALERLSLISDQLACVYRALSWYLYITPNRGNMTESHNKPAQWLQVLLEHRELQGIK